MNTTAEQNKTVVRKLFAEFGNGNLEVWDEVVAPDFVNRNDPAQPYGRDEWKSTAGMFLNAIPDIHIEVLEQVAEREFVTSRTLNSGTHLGDLMGVPPSGSSISVNGMYIDRVVDGRIVERWDVVDMMTLMTQIGAVPAPGG